MGNAAAARTIAETERLLIREIVETDASFINELLNTKSFLRYIGDRGVRSDDDARRFINERYRQSYKDHGYGLYTILLKDGRVPVGVCGFVRRNSLPGPDIGFAFLPEHERRGYGYESAFAIMTFGRRKLDLGDVYAITSPDNDASAKLLFKLGFVFVDITETPDGEKVKLFKNEDRESAY